MALMAYAVGATAATAVDVTISGIDGAALENVRRSLSIVQQAQTRDLTNDDLRRLHARATTEIQRALQPFGYYSVQVRGSLRQDLAAKTWHASYAVSSGPVTRLRKVQVRIDGQGRDDPELQLLIAKSGLVAGAPLLHQAYEDLKTALGQLALDRGYFDARFKRHNLHVRPAAQVADIDLLFATGPRYRFGAVQIEQDVLTSKRLAPYITIQPGEPFDGQRLLDLQFALSDSGYFDAVEVTVDRNRATNRMVPVVVRASPNKRNRYTAGVGYGTDTGPRLSLGMVRRWLNPEGHRWQADLRLSEIKNTLASRYLMPVGQIGKDYYAVNFDVEDTQDLGDGSTRAAALGLQRTQPWRDWERRLQLSVQREQSRFGSEQQLTTLVMPQITLSRSVADDALFPRKGWSLVLDLRGADESLLSDSSFLQGRITARYVQPLGIGRRLLLRGDLGSSLASAVNQLPASQRFFAGGDQSVRGYKFQTLGPRDAQGLVVGGQHLLVTSVEVDQAIRERWGVAAFFDAGNAANDFKFDFARGAGLGLRWRSPVGMVRIDLAHPLDDRDGAPDVRLHLGIGSDL